MYRRHLEQDQTYERIRKHERIKPFERLLFCLLLREEIERQINNLDKTRIAPPCECTQIYVHTHTDMFVSHFKAY